MKNYSFSIIMIMLLLLVVVFNNNITNYITNLISNDPTIVTDKSNDYEKDYSFLYVKNTKDFTPYSYNDLLNIVFTALNNGWNNFTFYCPYEYTDCIEDVKMLTRNNEVLTDINNYVHPFNSFSNLQTTISSSGEINLEVTKIYTNEEIEAIKAKINQIEKEIYKTDMDDIEKLQAAHDYIIKNAVYDTVRKDTETSQYKSNIAYGPLLEGYAICSGYADAMAIFISNLNYKNYKVASNTHVWNAIYINDSWVHIDVTWDDQIDTNGNEVLIHKFFLINTENLHKYAASDHEFKSSVYREFLNN